MLLLSILNLSRLFIRLLLIIFGQWRCVQIHREGHPTPATSYNSAISSLGSAPDSKKIYSDNLYKKSSLHTAQAAGKKYCEGIEGIGAQIAQAKLPLSKYPANK
jgi:hypothetical protein